MVIRAEQVDTDTLRALYRRIDRLEREIRELRASRRLESASIGGGGLRVRDGGSVTVDGGSVTVDGGWVEISGGRLTVYDVDGMPLAMLGDLGSGLRGTWIARAGGEVAMAVYGTGTGPDAGFVGLYDRSGNYVVTDDTASRRGLARPYITLQVGEWTVPTATTTSSTFEDLAAGWNPIQHPVMLAHVIVYASDAATAGQVRITVDGAQVGPTLTVPAGAFQENFVGPFALTVDESVYGEFHRVAVQARRTAGTGTVGVRVLALWGLESAFA